MAIQNDLVNKISKEKSIDQRVVRLIADYPLKFARERMADPSDWRPIRLRYFATFVPKERYKNGKQKEVLIKEGQD